VYRKGVLEAEGFAVADISDYLEEPDTLVWVDFCIPSKEQLEELDAEFRLHELAVEDALGPHQRPKLDSYATHLFLSCHAVRVDYDEVSDGIFAGRPLDATQQRHWFEMRRAMARFHRLAVPMREAVSSLMRVNAPP
jgi:magnesium transporter